MKKIFEICILLSFFALVSCKKDWLDVKPRDSQVVPTTIADAQALLDDNNNINLIYPTLELGSDDYELTYTSWLSAALVGWRNAYIWKSDIWEGDIQADWNNFYKYVFVSNVALETLGKIAVNNNNISSYNLAKGQALFVRAISNYHLATLYAKPYLQNTSNNDFGIPLRLSADINERSFRSTVQETYDQIIADAKASIPLLPVTPLFTTRPSKPAAYALLARVYLIRGENVNAEKYADSCLQLKNTLIDFNTLSLTSTLPIGRDNVETIYYSGFSNSTNLLAANLIVPSNVYQMYSANDLRKVIYFYTLNGKLTRKSSYTGTTSIFGGLAVDEVYLIRAEACARLGRTVDAMADLNSLLAKRFMGTYVPLTASNADAALSIILAERRKELIYRGLRWADLRRLNQDNRFAVTLVRVLNGENYTLPPNDKRYTYAIPEIEIRNYGMPQNER
ncbi:RagB/SusD family nutrient uptake outer membrane protein [Pedobacter sp.]